MADLIATDYPRLDAILKKLLDGSWDALDDNVAGLYLLGSLALGGFDSERSDVDFALVTNQPIDPHQHSVLEGLLKQLDEYDHKWAFKLEGAFLPASAFSLDENEQAYPSFDEARFSVDYKGLTSAIQKHTLREHGIVLVGPEPSTFVPPVSSAEVRDETLRLLTDWWRFKLTHPNWMHDRHYQSYAVVTMCRIHYTLATGEIVPKPEAAQWAKTQLSDQWHGLIDRALAWDYGDGVDDFAETLRFIQFTLDCFA